MAPAGQSLERDPGICDSGGRERSAGKVLAVAEPRSIGPLKVAVLLGAEPYQVYHAAGIAWELAERPGLEVEVVATLPETLAEFEKVSRTVGAQPLPTRLLHTPFHLRLLQKLAVFGSLKTAIMMHAANRKMLSQYAAIVTPTDHAGALRPHLNPRPLMTYVNHGVGGRAASYSDKYLNFDFVIVASRKDERRLLDEHLVRPGHYVVAYPKLELARELARTRAPLFASDRPIVLFNPHSKRSLRSWERFAKPLIAHAAATGEFTLIVAPHTKLFRRRPKFAWRRWERLAVPGRVIIDLGSERSLDMTYTGAADIYVGDVSSQVSEFLTTPKPCVFLNAHKVAWRGQKDFATWELGDVAETPDEAIAAIRAAQSRHHLYDSDSSNTSTPRSTASRTQRAGPRMPWSNSSLAQDDRPIDVPAVGSWHGRHRARHHADREWAGEARH